MLQSMLPNISAASLSDQIGQGFGVSASSGASNSSGSWPSPPPLPEYDRSEVEDLYRSGGVDALVDRYGQDDFQRIARHLTARMKAAVMPRADELNQYGFTSEDMDYLDKQLGGSGGSVSPSASVAPSSGSGYPVAPSYLRSGVGRTSQYAPQPSAPSFDGSAFRSFYDGLGSDQQNLIQGLMNRVGSFYRQQYSPMMGGGIMGAYPGYGGMSYGGYGMPYSRSYGMMGMGMGLGGYGMPYGGGYGMSYGGGYGMPYGGYGVSSFSSGSSPFGPSASGNAQLAQGGNGFYG